MNYLAKKLDPIADEVLLSPLMWVYKDHLWQINL